MINKIKKVLLEALPIVVMIGLISLIANDYVLSTTCLLIVILGATLKREKYDLTFLILGFVSMIFFELFFVSTGAETFARQTLFGMMPLYLPFIWAYAFMAIKRSVKILENA